MGLRSGDVESAAYNREYVQVPVATKFTSDLFLTININTFHSVSFRISHLYHAGRPLKGLENEIKIDLEAITALNVQPSKLVCLLYLSAVKKLAGTDIEESEMSLKAIEKLAIETGNQHLRALSFVTRLELDVFFQQWDDAANLLVTAGNLLPCMPGSFVGARFTFLEALISIKAAQSKKESWLKKRRWKKKALKAMKLIRGWVKKGNVNLVHSLHLLEAELAALDKKPQKAENSYKAAITVASTNGFLQDRALSHELASVYFAGKGDDYWKDYHMQQCLACYSEWGADAKVQQLSMDNLDV